MAKQYIVEVDNFRILKRAECSTEKTYTFMKAICESLIRSPNPSIVPVLSFHTVSKGFFHFRYNYLMQKLNPLSSFEKSVIEVWSGINDDDREDIPKYTPEQSDAISLAGQEQCPKLLKLMDEWRWTYWDFHAGNVMKDDDGEYRIIDLEGFSYDNYWFDK